MKRLLGAILLVTFLNGCAGVPLVSTLEGTLSINGAIAGVITVAGDPREIDSDVGMQNIVDDLVKSEFDNKKFTK